MACFRTYGREDCRRLTRAKKYPAAGDAGHSLDWASGHFSAQTARRDSSARCRGNATGNKRFQASKSMAGKLGGKLLSAYVTTGHYDVVLTLEMPNGEAMIKFASAITGSGNARTTTVRAYTPDEFSKLAADAPTM